MYIYKKEDFPAKDPYIARDITSPNFHLDKDNFELFKDKLYIDLEVLYQPENETDDNFVDKIKHELNIEEDALNIKVSKSKKLIFAGHIGSGKSVQLANLNDFFDHKNRYFSIFISLQEELDMSRFETEDYFIAMIIKLTEIIHERYPKIKTKELCNILKDWLGEEEISEERQDKKQTDLIYEAGLGINLLEMIKSKFNLKTHTQRSSQISTKVRTKVKKDFSKFIEDFNKAIDEIVKKVKEKDILFIIDGVEKFPIEQGIRSIYIGNYAKHFQKTKVNILTTNKLYELYHLDNKEILGKYLQIELPLINLREGKRLELVQSKFIEIAKKRINPEDFFTYPDQILKYYVKMSGGNIRQFLDIVSNSMRYFIRKKNKIDMEIAEKITQKMGKEMTKYLRQVHKNFIVQRRYETELDKLDTEEEDLLFHLTYFLFILKYENQYKLNPLLEEILK